MRNVNTQPQFTAMLASSNALKNEPMRVMDVGARMGPQKHWPVYGSHIQVIGFEPHVEECERLNAIAASFNVPFTCYPIGLSNQNTTTRLYEYPHNKAANSLLPPPDIENPQYTDIKLTTFDSFAAENKIDYIDFAKLDIERHEMQALEGMKTFLNPERPILGLEIEVHFQSKGENSADYLLSDIEIYLRQYGYCLVDIDVYRLANSALPSPVDFEHRNHNNEPILGHTISGKPQYGDALFMLDTAQLDRWPSITRNPTRMLKLISLYEMYGLQDIAAELLIKYSDFLTAHLPAGYTTADCLDKMVPDHFCKGMSYKEYLETYYKYVGRPYLYKQRHGSKEEQLTRAKAIRRFVIRHPILAAKRILQIFTSAFA